ncbi:uncharacterized protein LOC119725985 [Patiria miniata]|uniref:Uncharacterized protein n=1 Tax=Patiria miniata TaxID=46514 RepID=A0A913ZP15_PATMI|nr:uncharacterized protein LOC119725985 [Patiria miniata]
MDFQIVNVAHPNSIKNTVVFSCFEATDSMANIRRALPPIFEQLSVLSTLKWRGRSLRVFLFGDYELLNKVYGICGCNARYCCVYCLASKKTMQLPIAERGPCLPRNLQNIREHHQLFLEDGARPSRAKDVSYSIVNPSLIPIETDHVIIPTLHISLGVYKKLFDLLERACHDLDVKLFQLRVTSQDHEEGTNFDDQIAAEIQRQNKIQQDLTEKRSALEQAEEELPLYALRNNCDKMDEAFRDTATSVFKLRADIRDLEQDALSAKLTYATGPIASALDRVLHDHKVQRQAYHGKAFVGNHVNKCCEPKLIDALTKVPRKSLKDS